MVLDAPVERSRSQCRARLTLSERSLLGAQVARPRDRKGICSYLPGAVGGLDDCTCCGLHLAVDHSHSVVLVTSAVLKLREHTWANPSVVLVATLFTCFV